MLSEAGARERYTASALAGAARYDAAIDELAGEPALDRLARHSIAIIGCGGLIGSAVGAVLARLAGRLGGDAPRPIGVARHRGGWPHRFPFLTRDISDREADLPAADYCVYLAGPAGDYWSAPTAAIDVHLNGLIAAMASCGTDGFVYVSSTRVYSRRTPPPFREDQPIEVGAPSVDDLYDAAKRWAEAYCLWEVEHRSRRAVIARLSNAYGPYASSGHSIASLAQEIWRDRRVTLTGPGASARDYCAAADAAAGLLQALVLGVSGRAYNIGGGDVWTSLDLARHLGSHAPFAIDIITGDGQSTASWPDLTRARTELGYLPRLTLRALGAAPLAWAEPTGEGGPSDGRH